MGNIVNAICSCSYTRDFLMIGVGFNYMSSNSAKALAFSEKKNEVLVVDVGRERIDPDQIHFYSPALELIKNDLSKDKLEKVLFQTGTEIPDVNYCPKCKQQNLKFKEVGSWD